MGQRWIAGELDDAIVVDDSYFPIVVATWHGAPTARAVRGYFQWLDTVLERAQQRQVPIVNVTDSSSAGIPTAEVRRVIADLTKQWELAGADGRRVHSMVVVDNAVIRGVLRALAWLHGGMKSEQFATCEEALRAAVTVLSRAGIPTPAGLYPAAWKRPGRSPGTTIKAPRARP